MSTILPTVRILHPELEGGVIINEDDLTDEHVLHDPKAEKARRANDKKAAAAAAQEEVDEAQERVASAMAALAAIKDKTEQGATL
jgi:hypothetical protein